MKQYKTLNDVPQQRMEGVAQQLREGNEGRAGELLDAILVDIKEIPMYEVFHLRQKFKLYYFNRPEQPFVRGSIAFNSETGLYDSINANNWTWESTGVKIPSK